MATNLKLFCAEIDLLFNSSENELIIVEVKSVREDLAWRNPVGQKQAIRLRKAFEHMLIASPKTVRMHLAAVDQLDEVMVFKDFLSDYI
ncbi:MAG: hypothetical protein A2Z20_10595 [Bdellovibrionales bacterium RBG_16_40_8]|nr:MAG: hypothetical protein A2Z20_10595 [Bdellovibrionales bacterium RBG_16_40_8]